MKNKERKLMSYYTGVKYAYLGTGISFMLSGIFGIFNNIIAGILSLVFSALAIYMIAKPLTKNIEDEDEMARANIDRARSIALVTGASILIISSVIVNLISSAILFPEINLTRFIHPFVISFVGIEYIIVAITFKNLEKE